MGWTTEIREFDMCDVAQLQKEVEATAHEEREQYGYEPSGYWGSRDNLTIKTQDKIFPDAGSASVYLNDAIERHGPLIAVKFYDMSISQKETVLRQKISAIETTLNKQNVAVAKRIRKTAQTSYQGGQCPHCKNKWCAEYLSMEKCQLCRIPYWSAEDKSKREKNLVKQADLKQKLEIEKKETVKTGTIKWMVSGSAPV